MNRFLLVFLLSHVLFIAHGQSSFEGQVNMSITNGKELINRTVWVKQSRIRVEETIGKNPNKKTIYLINGSAKKGYILSEERSLFMETTPWKPSEPMELSEPTVTETDSLLGTQVERWELMEKDLKRAITFYFSPNDFHFYRDMLHYLPERDYLERLFLQLPLAEDVMPIKASWKDLNGQLIYQLNVTAIKSFSPPDQLFAIPEEYEQF